MNHISDALHNVSFLTTLKDHQSKEAEVPASETLYVGYHLMLYKARVILTPLIL